MNFRLISAYLFWIYVGMTFVSIFTESLFYQFLSFGITCFFYSYALDGNKFIMLKGRGEERSD